MRLDPLYTVTFTTPEAWSVEVASDAGIEGRGFLLAEGRSAGRLSARYRAANFPRKRSDGALVPEFRGVLETDDGAVILFEWQGLAVLGGSGFDVVLEISEMVWEGLALARSVYLAYPPIERADHLLVADLVCIVVLLVGVHRSTWKRHRRDVQRERAVRYHTFWGSLP